MTQAQSPFSGVGPQDAAVGPEVQARLRLPEHPQFLDGFTLELSCYEINTVGYIGVRVRATPTAGVFPAERNIRLRVTPVGRSDVTLGKFRAGSRLDLSFSQGAKTYEQTFFVPKYSLHTTLHVEAFEAGQSLAGYEGRLGQLAYMAQGDVQQAMELVMRTGVIVADEVRNPKEPWQRCPDVRSIDIQLNPTTLPRHDLATDLDSEQRLAMLPTGAVIIDRLFEEGTLSDNWKDYSTLDILLVAFPLLERLAEQQPERWQAIRHWAASGGNLWVYAAESPERLSALFQTASKPLQAHSSEFVNAHRAAQQAAARWRAFGNDSTVRQRVSYIDRELEAGISRAALAERCWMQFYFGGTLFGIAGEDPFPGSPIMWGTAAELAGPRTSALVRRGVEPVYGSVSFWEWVLLDVAQPPVYSFLLLLGLFALFVGPVAYYKTTRGGRAYLMFLIAPALAISTTLLMFGYGLVVDGLGNKARIRQITWVDGSSGHGARWSRATYFSGMRQSDGLRFPPRAAVFPFPRNAPDQHDLGESQDEMPVHWVSVGPDQQQFGAEFLPTRQLCQFVTIEPRDDLGKLVIASTDAEGNPVGLANRFDFDLERVIFRQETGEYRVIESLPSGAAKASVAIDAMEAANRIRTWYVDSVPEVPPGFDVGNRRLTAGKGFAALLERKHGWGARAIRQGVFEHRLRTVAQLSGELPPGSLIGWGTFTPEMLALPAVELNDSVHFVMGTLP